MSFFAQYPAISSGTTTNASVGPNGSTAPTSSTEIGGVNGSGNLTPVSVDNSGNVNVNVIASPLPTGAATAAKQDVGNASLSSLDAKIASSDVSEDYDYRAFSYVGATQKIDTIVYKTGGSGGTTVATQTFGYDGSDRLTSIAKT